MTPRVVCSISALVLAAVFLVGLHRYGVAIALDGIAIGFGIAAVWARPRGVIAWVALGLSVLPPALWGIAFLLWLRGGVS
jgi:hypothetical protein